MYITHYIPDTVLDTIRYDYNNLFEEMQLLSLFRSEMKMLKAYNVILDYPALSILLISMFLGASEKCLMQGSGEFIVQLTRKSKGGISSFRHS